MSVCPGKVVEIERRAQGLQYRLRAGGFLRQQTEVGPAAPVNCSGFSTALQVKINLDIFNPGVKGTRPQAVSTSSSASNIAPMENIVNKWLRASKYCACSPVDLHVQDACVDARRWEVKISQAMSHQSGLLRL